MLLVYSSIALRMNRIGCQGCHEVLSPLVDASLRDQIVTTGTEPKRHGRGQAIIISGKEHFIGTKSWSGFLLYDSSNQPQ